MEIKWKNYEISSKWVGDKVALWDKEHGRSQDRHHIITISDADNKDCGKISFDYWTSIMHPDIDSEDDLLTAVECLFSDASFYDEGVTFEEFCRNSGYDIPDGIWDSYIGCRHANAKVKHMFGDNWDELAEELRDRI